MSTATAAGRPTKQRRIPVKHKSAIAIFIAPFAVLFSLFYLLPIGWAI